MYITIKNINRTLGKHIELKDLFLGLPIFFFFLILFAFTPFKIHSLVFLTIGVFLMLPVQMSKKNRMYKIVFLFFRYLFKCKEYSYFK